MDRKFADLVLASHGTPGARAAEAIALDLCAERGASLHHLYVVPDFWKGMMGDDWLNNAVTQIRFGRYVENQLARETAEEVDRLADQAEKRGVAISVEVRLGKPAECLLEFCAQRNPGLVVIGSPRPKGSPGLRSRMALEPLAHGLAAPLLIVPHPGR